MENLPDYNKTLGEALLHVVKDGGWIYILIALYALFF